MSLSHNDNIEPKTIENGVVVPPGLQVGVMTLKEHQDYLVWMQMKRRLTREEAVAADHRPAEINEYFEDRGHGTLPELPPPQPNAAPTPVATAVIIPPSGRSGFDRIVPEPQRSLVAAAEPATKLSGVIARTMGFTGDVCIVCQGVRMVRNGSCLMCNDCGQTTGCA